MQPKKIWAMYFSPTDGTKKITTFIAKNIAKKLGVPLELYNFTLPQMRERRPTFAPSEVVVFGMPTYAGRVPNLFVPYVQSLFGNFALCVPVVSYGARAFDDSLIELRDLLEKGNFRTIGGAALVSLHAFSTTLGAGRPNDNDWDETRLFAQKMAAKIALNNFDFFDHAPIEVAGEIPYRTHMRPKNGAGEFIKFLPIKTVTNDKCVDCKICAKVCPLGSIDFDDVKTTPGKCIKCNACVKKCPEDAKSFPDSDYIFHKEELEELYTHALRTPAFFL